jgi:tetratricopeptide (TPR) repeat protein
VDRATWNALRQLALSHIATERFTEAEVVARQLLAAVDPSDAPRLWELSGLLASVLNSLGRWQEATLYLERALEEARYLGADRSAVGVSRYMLSNQHLIFGSPADALAVAEPVPPGVGHVQCLLHLVAAQALWKLSRHDAARQAARDALASSPTGDRTSMITDELQKILWSQ